MASTRDRILDAAEGIVIRDGVSRLTIEAAAAEAGLSKGGILYHFGTRDALVSGMVERLIADFDNDVEAAHTGSAHSGAPGEYVRAYIQATVELPRTAEDERRERAGAAILAAMAAEPALLQPLRDAFERWQSRLVADGIDPVAATVARLAADGLWLSELFGLGPLEPALRKKVAHYLDGLAR